MAHQSDFRNWLAENPKMMGALWALIVILAETGKVAADNGTVIGP
ncbi:DUF7503 family protein [Halorussus salinisoli]